MPLVSCIKNNLPGYKYGEGNNSCFTYNPNDEASRKQAKLKAIKQAAAIEHGGKLELSKEDLSDLVKDFDIELDEDLIKYDDEHNLVFGWGYISKTKEGVQSIDHSGDFVTDENFEDLELAVYAYNLIYRESDIGHTEKPSGNLIESVVFSKEKMEKMGIPPGILPQGIWVGYHFSNDEDYQMIKAMKKPMLSLFGKVQREYVKEEV